MYTSLAVSKLIQAKCPDVETEMYWVDVFPVFNDELRLSPKHEFEHHLSKSILSDTARELVKYNYAYTLADVIKSIKVLGDSYTHDGRIARSNKFLQHSFLDTYLPSLSLQDPQVEKFLIDLFNN